MPDPAFFQPPKPSVGARVAMTRTCCICGARKPIVEMRYMGPITEESRDPARFACTNEHERPT